MALPRSYTILAPVLSRMVRTVARPFLPKLATRVAQQNELLRCVPPRTGNHGRVLIHAASMGELEQCVPVIEVLRDVNPSLDIIISCSSPSGLRHAKTLSGITAVVYHPFEERHDVASFVAHVQPDVVVIDRYDVWPLFVDELHSRVIPVVLINATFPSSATNRLLRSAMSTTYRRLSHITAVTPDDARALQDLVGHDVPSLPDSRVDRVCERVTHAREAFAHLRRDTITLVIGSSWDDDLAILIPSIKQISADDLRVIIVPHEPTESTLTSIETQLPCTRLSHATAETLGHIVVDTVGALLSLYALADAAYVGGGFGAGVHSVLEPAGYGIPLACGPRIDRSRDAVALRQQGACTVLRSQHEADRWIHEVVRRADARQRSGAVAHTYVASQTGSSNVYAVAIQQFITERS